MLKERTEERQLEELKLIHEQSGQSNVVDKMNWMYAGPPSSQTERVIPEIEALLAEEPIVTRAEEEALSKQTDMFAQHANSARDIAAKIRDDPLLAIKRQEQAAYEAILRDPVKRQQLFALANGMPVKNHKSRRDRGEDGRDSGADRQRDGRRRGRNRSTERRRQEQHRVRSRSPRRYHRSSRHHEDQTRSEYRSRSRSVGRRHRDRSQSPERHRSHRRSPQPASRSARSQSSPSFRRPPSTVSRFPTQPDRSAIVPCPSPTYRAGKSKRSPSPEPGRLETDRIKQRARKRVHIK